MADLDPTKITKVVTPLRRVLRTVVLSLATWPAAILLLPTFTSLSTGQAAGASGFALAIVNGLTAGLNAWDGSGGTDTPALGVTVAPATQPVG